MRKINGGLKSRVFPQKIAISILLVLLLINSIPPVSAMPSQNGSHWEIMTTGLREDNSNTGRNSDQIPFPDYNNAQPSPTNEELTLPETWRRIMESQTHNPSPSLFIHLSVASFDPLINGPQIASDWKYDSENGYFLAQCYGPILIDWKESIVTSGAIILGYIPDFTYLVQMDGEAKGKVEEFQFVRWIGSYHPAYKIQSGLPEKEGKLELNIIVFKDDEKNLLTVRNRLKEMGGEITYDGDESHIIRVRIDASLVRDIAFIPEVEWIDEYSEPFTLMNNVRVFTGAEKVNTNGFDGMGIVGEVKDNGCDLDHPDFEGQMIGTDGNPGDEAHGTCTFGIVFSSGQNDDNALGMMPNGKGIFSDWSVSRTNSISNLVNDWGGLFQSNSWSQGGLNSQYSSYSQENDQVVIDYDIAMLYAAGNSNSGVHSESCSQDSVAKNVICVGAVDHFDDTDRSNDFWVNNGMGSTPSQGPAADGRIKPDIAGVFDAIYTTDSVDGDGENGYASGNYFANFGGTSGATPIAAGATGLLYQMYIENFFGNNPSYATPHAATVKAILIADAYQYEFYQATRYQQGWGLVDLENIYDIGKNHFIVDEEVSLQTGEHVNYTVNPTSNNPLKITLVWTDVPGTTSSSQHLINDLDLKVTAPDDVVYYGNEGLLNSKWSFTGGSYDRLNNVENVFIENPMEGDWVIEITGYNIPMDGNPKTQKTDQSFALVASGVFQAEHDLGASDLKVSDYLAPNEAATIEATVFNNGLTNESDVTVNFTVDDSTLDSRIIPNLSTGEETSVSFNWIPQMGIYTVGVEVEILPNEITTDNNFLNKTVIVEPDLSISDFKAPKYLSPNKKTDFNATVNNLGKIDAMNAEVQLLINGTLEDSFIISSFPAETSQIVSMSWIPPMEGWYKIELYIVPVVDEELVSNNQVNVSLLSTSKELKRVAILDSWGTDYSEEAPWDHINDNWMFYGTTPVEIDYTSLNKNDITYNELVATKADVLIISCAFVWEFSDSEIDAINLYVQEGHGLIATSGTFYWYVPNNNKLASLFGMQDDMTYYDDITSNLDLIEPTHPLFYRISDPYAPGSEVTVLPSDLSWDADDLTEGRYLAKSFDSMGAIIENKGLVYISHWIGSESTPEDVQLFYNAITWSKYQQESHDIAVVDIQVPPFLTPNQQTFVNATVVNIGLGDEKDITINFNVNGNLEDSILIPNLDSSISTSVNFIWTSPLTEGNYNVEIESIPLPNENNLRNNRINRTVLVSSGPKLGRIALISDGVQLQGITPTLDDLGKYYDIFNDNTVNEFTKNITLLLQYQIVLFYNYDRAIDTEERKTLNDYLEVGGVLLVTGFDSLGSPPDTHLADVVKSSVYGDNMGESLVIVTNGSHPIMSGVYGKYSSGSSFTLQETNHDIAEADFTKGGQTLAELGNGYDKITAAELPLGGKVVYWNGNRNCNDWTQDVDMEAMLKNFIVWIMPIYDDVGIISLSYPAMSFIGENIDFQATLMNYGKNHQYDVEVTIEIRNSYDYLMYSEIQSGIFINSEESTSISWQWKTSISDYYTIEITSYTANDEVATNDKITGQIPIYLKFFTDDMENGEGEWDVSASSLVRPPLWHQIDTESYSPITSWWCGEDTLDQYMVLADQYLTSPIIDLTEATSAFLRFYHMYSIDDFPLLPDWGEVEINPDDTGWEALEAYNGVWLDWNLIVFDISSYVGQDIQIRFTLSSGVLLTDNGWWVDDVEIFGMGNQYAIDLRVDFDTLEVGKNESALYQIHAKNTGNTPGMLMMIANGTGIDNWDMVFNPNLIFNIDPGEEIMVNLTVTPQSAAYGDYPFDVIGFLVALMEAKANDTLPLILTVNQWFGVSLDSDYDYYDIVPSTTKYFEITVKNEGNGPDTILLTSTQTITGVSSSWQFQLNKTSIYLDAFQEENITLSVTSPYDGYPDDSIVINVMATSQGNTSQVHNLTTTTVVMEYYSIELSCTENEKEIEPGASMNFDIMVINHGNSLVNVNLDVTPITGSWEGWNAALSTNGFNLGAFSSKSIYFDLTPPGNAVAYTYKEFELEGSSSESSSSIDIKGVVALTGELQIDVEDSQKEGNTGEEIFYSLTLTNQENHEDTFAISASSINGWDITVLKTDGTTQLSDSGMLDPWVGTKDILVSIKIPLNALAFTIDKSTITFTSYLPNSTSEFIVLSTRVLLSGDIALSAESNSKSDLPGARISYMVSVGNNLNSEAAIDLTVSSENGWEIELLHGNGFTHLYDNNQNNIPDTGELTAFNGKRDVIIDLTIPDDAIAFTKEVITVSASTSLSGIGTYSIELKANVNRIHDVDIALEGGELSVVRGETLIYTIEISNSGNYHEILDIRFSEIPARWQTDFSDNEPFILVDESDVIAVNIEIPLDTDPGDYLVIMKVTSDDGTPAGDLSLTIEVREKEEEFAFPSLLLLFLILVIGGILAIVFLLGRRQREEGEEIEESEDTISVEETGIGEVEREYEVPTPPPLEYEGPMFPSIEIITCPVCYDTFEVEIDLRPYRVHCPTCGAGGTVK